jgi:hypothetical protein
MDKQEIINDLWKRYSRTLERLNEALDQLAQKPKEVERIVEVESSLNVEMPDDIAALEAKVEQKLADEQSQQ